MKIKKLTIVNNAGAKEYEVGKKVYGDNRVVGEIKDNGIEWENGIDWIFEVKDENGKPIATIVNCPVDVMYFPKEESKLDKLLKRKDKEQGA